MMGSGESCMGDSARDVVSDRSEELERLLQESRRRLEESQQLATIGSWEWELDEMSSNWSRELLRIFGRDPEGPQPSIDELVAAVHPEDRGEFERFVARVRTKPGRFDYSYRIVDAAGETRYLQARGRTVTDDAGKPIRTFGTTQDITELKLTEQNLRQRIEQQAGVALLGRYALSATDLPALMDEAVRMVSSVLSVDLVEVLELDEREETFRIKAGFGWEPGTIGQTTPANCTQMVHALREGVALVSDYNSEDRFAPVELLSRHGARSGIAAAIEGGDRTYGTIGAHSTEVRRFSIDDAHFLEAVGNVLGAAIERQRSEKIKAQLEQAQRLESVGQLAGGVAHDFNNLLLVILSYAECLIADGAEEPALTSLKEIERAASSAADLTRQLLLFSRGGRPEAGGVDLVDAVRETEALLRRTIGEHIELAVEATAGPAPVNLSPGQIDQILVNLAVNARDALPQGGRIAVTVRAVDPRAAGSAPPSDLQAGKAYFALTVADDGEGMSAEVAAQAFDPFFTTKPRGQGTGLGLATVYGIVSQAGGLVEIESEPARGTKVHVYLPAGEEIDDAGAQSGPSAGASGEGRTVLVVDNERAVRTIVCHMLERNGYRTRAAASAASAEEIIGHGAEDVDLLLTDVLMPGVSGRELVERIHARMPGLRAVYMSGYSGDSSSPLGPREDGATVLEKPFTAAQLIRAVGEALA